MPDEVNRLAAESVEPDSDQLMLFAAAEAGAPKKSAGRETRCLITPHDDLRPVYLNTQGLRVGKSGAVLQVKERDALCRRSGYTRSAN